MTCAALDFALPAAEVEPNEDVRGPVMEILSTSTPTQTHPTRSSPSMGANSGGELYKSAQVFRPVLTNHHDDGTTEEFRPGQVFAEFGPARTGWKIRVMLIVVNIHRRG